MIADVSAETLLRDMTAEGQDVSTNSFLRALVEQLGITFEAARDEIYRLLDSRRAVLTSKYTLRAR